MDLHTDNKKSHIPTNFVILGATGDLMTKKIVPALFNLYAKGELPSHFRLIGVSRRDWKDEDLKRHIEAILDVKVKHATPEAVKGFLRLAVYQKLEFSSFEDYLSLRDTLRKLDDERGLCSNKLFYLSVPPQFYEEILINMHKARLGEPCGKDEGWTRIVVEKPFGNDEKSAKALDVRLENLFTEDQIYRIDHYLAKETFQNVLAFRFSNNLFEDAWGNELIEKIYVREFENIGVEDRGPFYDPLGALRDVGQNHMIQMAALTAMDQPRNLSSEEVRRKRADIIETFTPLTPAEVKKQTFRAQYEGYHSIKGVVKGSQTETYFRARFSSSHPRWRGVTFIMEAGKRLMHPREEKEVTEIEVVFKHPEPCLCRFYIQKEGRSSSTGHSASEHSHQHPDGHFRNSIVFHQDPHEGITIRFWSKKPGFKMELEERTLDFNLRGSGVEHKSQYTEEYEKLLLDAILGDQTLFISSEEIAAMWKFIDPIEAGWKKNLVPLRHYVPDGPAVTIEAQVIDEAPAPKSTLPKEIGVFGLGKMGANVARQLKDKGWRVVVANRSPEPAKALESEGFEAAFSHEDFLAKSKPKASSRAPRLVWVMITAGKGIDEFLFGEGGIVQHLKKGDIVIDAGNSLYEDTVRRAKILNKKGITFMDVGFSGGPSGARNGGSLMIGGDRKTFAYAEPLFKDLSVRGGYAHFGAAGAGHFVKMVHNGIEYGMMQSLAEGFALMKKSPFKLDLEKVTNIYNHGSVIESRLVGWLEDAYRIYGQDLKKISGSVAYTGEGEWTIAAAKKMRLEVPAIEDAFKFRVRSKKKPSYTGKILSALRNRFGGHAIDQGEK